MWLAASIGSALFAGLTAILAKCGIRRTDSDIATAIRTIVVLIFSWVMVFIVGSADQIAEITPRSLLFLILSGAATGASWICYFKALSIGDVNKVVPIDKSSTVLSVLLAILLFHETEHLAVKLISTVLLGVGIILMVEKKKSEQKVSGNTYILYAIGSAVFAALTSILAKVGITGVESNLGTAIRTIVVLVMAWLLVLIKKKTPQLKQLDKKELGFIGLSGIATGASWLCYYYAIQNGIVSVVVPIDKMSLLVTVIFSYFAFHEKLSKKAFFRIDIDACRYACDGYFLITEDIKMKVKTNYEDIINLPHHVSSKRPQMPMLDRAAQFSPFAALTGYDDAIHETGRLTDEKIDLSEEEKEALDRKQQILMERLGDHPALTVTYFVPDAKKSGGAYVTKSGNLKKIDEFERLMMLMDGTKIPLDNVADIESELFRDMF